MTDILYCGNDKVFDGVLTSGLSIVRRLDAPRPLTIHIFTMELTRVSPNYLPMTRHHADIIETALREKASVVGLSALMTTTMMHMKDVIAEAADKQYGGKIIIGGAAVTPSFSDEIGADGYSKDAADCVKLVSRLLS